MQKAGQKPEASEKADAALPATVLIPPLPPVSRLLPLLLAGFFCSYAAWLDAAWPHRRSLEVKWDVDHANGEDVAWADVFTAGTADEKGADLRIATDAGKVVPSKVLFTGPGRFDPRRVRYAQGRDEVLRVLGQPQDRRQRSPNRSRPARPC